MEKLKQYGVDNDGAKVLLNLTQKTVHNTIIAKDQNEIHACMRDNSSPGKVSMNRSGIHQDVILADDMDIICRISQQGKPDGIPGSLSIPSFTAAVCICWRSLVIFDG